MDKADVALRNTPSSGTTVTTVTWDPNTIPLTQLAGGVGDRLPNLNLGGRKLPLREVLEAMKVNEVDIIEMEEVEHLLEMVQAAITCIGGSRASLTMKLVTEKRVEGWGGARGGGVQRLDISA
jgi:hypothetical protein